MQVRSVSVPQGREINSHVFFEKTDEMINNIRGYNDPWGKLTIVVQDYTRGTMFPTYVGSIISRFYEKFKAEDVTILIANGMHRACSDMELELMFGASACGKYRIYQNNPMGVLPRDLLNFPVVGIHRSSPHIKVGFTAAGKMIIPGLADRMEAHQWHRGDESCIDMMKLNSKFSHIIDFVLHPGNLTLMDYFVGRPDGELVAYRKRAYDLHHVDVVGNADVVYLQPRFKNQEFHQAMNGIYSLHLDMNILRRGGLAVLYLPNTHSIGVHYMFGRPNGMVNTFYDEAFPWLFEEKQFVIFAPWLKEYLIQEHFKRPIMVFNELKRLEAFIFSRFGDEAKVEHYLGSDVIVPVVKGEESGINV